MNNILSSLNLKAAINPDKQDDITREDALDLFDLATLGWSDPAGYDEYKEIDYSKFIEIAEDIEELPF